MTEALKALAVVFMISFGGFVYAKAAFGEIAPGSTFARWRNVYLAATLAIFLIPNFWVFLFAIALISVTLGAREKNKPALYLLLLFALPVADDLVPGFGGIQNFLILSPFNILALAILIPLLFAPQENRAFHRTGSTADYFFIGYSLLMLALAFRDTSITDGFRQSAAYMLTAFGPYLAFSRVNWTKERLKAVTLAFVVPLLILSAIAIIEAVLSWHVFAAAVDNWAISNRARYNWRSGFLRAYATIFEPISFGLFISCAIALSLALLSSLKKRTLAIAGLGLLCLGLLFTFSRGPWVGAAFAAVVFAATSERFFSNMTRLVMLGLAGMLALSVTPAGDQIIALIPFVGGSSTDSINYRQQLMEIGWQVAMENKWFGSEYYLNHPAMQALVQGQGIIDIVNSYLRVTLESGLVGLTLFGGVSAFSMLAAFRAISVVRAADRELAVYCQAWLAALAGLMLTIATTSSVVAQVAEVHWLLCGMCVGVARSAAAARFAAKAQPPVAGDHPPPAGPPDGMATAPAKKPQGSLPPHLRQYADR